MSQPQPAREARRKMVGWLCIGTANTLEQIQGGVFGQDHAQYLNAKELNVWREALVDLSKCERRLRKLGKHLLKGEYGGH